MEIYCRNCGKRLSENDKVCPYCSCNEKNIVVTFVDKIEVHDQIKGKVKRKDVKKPVQEFKVGDNLHRKSGKWYHREMYIDRENNYYREIVKDKTTGEIIRKCEEPLSKHRGHGSAKNKRLDKEI